MKRIKRKTRSVGSELLKFDTCSNWQHAQVLCKAFLNRCGLGFFIKKCFVLRNREKLLGRGWYDSLSTDRERLSSILRNVNTPTSPRIRIQTCKENAVMKKAPPEDDEALSASTVTLTPSMVNGCRMSTAPSRSWFDNQPPTAISHSHSEDFRMSPESVVQFCMFLTIPLNLECSPFFNSLRDVQRKPSRSSSSWR